MPTQNPTAPPPSPNTGPQPLRRRGPSLASRLERSIERPCAGTAPAGPGCALAPTPAGGGADHV